ncbi:MAG: hypothetical protein OXP73_11000 [Chloroflexota bacterium]|nr:hypothetical protein [Chloroflexota bacterium]
MQNAERETSATQPEESWNAIHDTMDRARSSMYVAGMESIMLLWGVIVALGLLGQSAISAQAPEFAAESPWFPAPLWGVLTAAGFAASAILGHRASARNAAGAASKRAGLRVFFFWLTVTGAAFIVPAAAGLWTADVEGITIARVSIGIVALGYTLFGIMHRPVLAAVGVGFAAPFYLSSHFAGDAAIPISAAATLLVVSLGAAWIRWSDSR